MGKLNKLDFIFDNPDAVCYSGTALRGSVVVDLNGKIKIKEIRLRFHGYSNVSWSERHSSGTGKNKRSVTKNFNADELYFDHTVGIFDSGYNEVQTLTAGFHTFPFEFHVPAGCPTSYEGSVGKIRYYVSATIEKLFGVEHVALRLFTVVNQLDVNNDPRLQEMSEASSETNLCCFCCKSGPILATLTVDTIGYVPGEVIPLRMTICNQSGRRITGATISLLMMVKYIASKKTKTHTNVVATVDHGPIAAGKTEVWDGDKLVVPSLPPSLLNACGIIHIAYVLELTVHPAGPAFDLPIKMEVIVGTIPLKSVSSAVMPSDINSTRQHRDNNRFVNFNKHRPSSKQRSSKTNDVPEMNAVKSPPPSLKFLESVLGKVAVDDEVECDKIIGKIMFAPMYPYYSINLSQNADNFQVIKTTTTQRQTSING